ncbi:Gti1/Pac2 family-domain-containing protein [Scheffersomyces amazonensis]|uniref:Gti1/Pac2 family-domain-containing protein n=1 Tax=Scheffersomyces amazonensis TaxID=1078765 RepID=UPI00315C6188
MSSSKLSPSYYGYVGSTKDALLIIQEILEKQLESVPRRPHERERPSLIKSGNVFVFIEEHSGIKRWTDGIAWSPSRILGRFLVYRELDKHSLSEKDDKKKKKRKVSINSDNNSDPLDKSNPSSSIPHAQRLLQIQNDTSAPATSTNSSTEYNKTLLGTPVVSSYVFKDQGLIKKTLSLTTNTKDLHIEKKDEKQTIHLISYYNADDVLNGKLQRPSETDLKNVTISNSLWNAVKDSSLGGKIPIEDEAYYFLDTNYQLQNMSLLQQPPNSVQYLSQKYGPSAYQQQVPAHQQYMLPVPSQQGQGQQLGQEYPVYKREDDSGGDLTFINPFTGGTHTQVSYGANNAATVSGGGSAPSSTSAASVIPMYNSYLGPPQQQYSYMQPPSQQSGSIPQQHDGATGGQTSYFPPFPQHFQQQSVYPQYHFMGQSTNEQYPAANGASTNMSNGGSVSSIASTAIHSANQGSYSGPQSASGNKKQFRASTSSTTGAPGSQSNGWFASNPPSGYIASIPQYGSSTTEYSSTSTVPSNSSGDPSLTSGIASPLPHNVNSYYVANHHPHHTHPSHNHIQHYSTHQLANSTTSASGNDDTANPPSSSTIGNTGLYSYSNS